MNRLDKELVERGLTESRTKSQELIEKGLVFVNGEVVKKASVQIQETDELKIYENDIFKYVSRGGFKLEKALKVFDYNVNNKTVMDIGSSTGGFTDCALQNGAKRVVAIDVGTDVMHKSLREDNRVELYENTNIKNVSRELFKDIDLIVVDVSFISLSKIIEKVAEQEIKVDMICLIKPQFECGKEIAAKFNGLILNKDIHQNILKSTIGMFNKHNFSLKGLDFSPIKGGDGNVEYLAFITNKKQGNVSVDLKKLIEKAFE